MKTNPTLPKYASHFYAQDKNPFGNFAIKSPMRKTSKVTNLDKHKKTALTDGFFKFQALLTIRQSFKKGYIVRGYPQAIKLYFDCSSM